MRALLASFTLGEVESWKVVPWPESNRVTIAVAELLLVLRPDEATRLMGELGDALSTLQLEPL